MKTVTLASIDFDSAIEGLIEEDFVNVIFDNNEMAVMNARSLIVHLIFWKVARRFGVVITPDFAVNTENIHTDTFSEIGTKILNEVRKTHVHYHHVAFDFNDSMNQLNRFVTNNCQEHHRSLSILDLIKVSEIPGIRAITSKKVSDVTLSIKEAGKMLKSNVAKLYKELKKPHPDNAIESFINQKFVKDVQLSHIFHQIGLRTDINDSIVRYIVQGNYLNGIRNMAEHCLESLSAKKSEFYNKDSLPTTEYFGRKQHILLSAIKYVYPGDCGTNITMPMFITEKLKRDVLYKNIDTGSSLVTLTEDNIDQYVNTLINYRTPMACRYRDGVCEVCGGALISSITPHTHIGIYSAIQSTSKITQVVLSAKHMQETNSVEYAIPDSMKNILVKVLGNVFLHTKLAERFKDATLVFAGKDAVRLMGLSDFNLKSIRSINESSYGVCRELVIMKNNSQISEVASLEVNNQCPMYSKYLIKYISEHPENATSRDELFMVNLKDYDLKNPIFRLTTMNNSMVRFVGAAQALLENKVSHYTSATALVNDFANLIYEQVHPNLSFVEIVLRGGMISGKYDYRAPVVTDIDRVRFRSNGDVNRQRSVGAMCAYEQLPKAVSNPIFFLVPKELTPFDLLLNLHPRPGSILESHNRRSFD